MNAGDFSGDTIACTLEAESFWDCGWKGSASSEQLYSKLMFAKA
jgi:hypothetical protein